MRSLKEIHPPYADEVDFYVVNVDPTESLSRLEAFGEREGYPWDIVQPGRGDLARYKVTYQSTKVAFGADGVIVYRAGFGDGGAQEWRALFERLSSG